MACVTSDVQIYLTVLFPVSCLLIKEQDLEIGKNLVIGKTTAVHSSCFLIQL